VGVFILHHSVKLGLLIGGKHRSHLLANLLAERVALRIERFELRLGVRKNRIQLLLLIRRQAHLRGERPPLRTTTLWSPTWISAITEDTTSPQPVSYSSDKQSEEKHHQHEKPGFALCPTVLHYPIP
jgi:hypothetical protein